MRGMAKVMIRARGPTSAPRRRRVRIALRWHHSGPARTADKLVARRPGNDAQWHDACRAASLWPQETGDQTMTVRPRRSVLYMPGSNARALEKARELPADALILDLEDAVAPDAKAMARELIVKIAARTAVSANARCWCGSTGSTPAGGSKTSAPSPRRSPMRCWCRRCQMPGQLARRGERVLSTSGPTRTSGSGR